jgi:hypothetical protein
MMLGLLFVLLMPTMLLLGLRIKLNLRRNKPMSYRIEAATKEEWAERALSGEKKLDDLKDSIKELFSLLDVTEETDEGRVHRPVQIVCVRSDMLMKLEAVLATLKSTMEDKG